MKTKNHKGITLVFLSVTFYVLVLIYLLAMVPSCSSLKSSGAYYSSREPEPIASLSCSVEESKPIDRSSLDNSGTAAALIDFQKVTFEASQNKESSHLKDEATVDEDYELVRHEVDSLLTNASNISRESPSDSELIDKANYSSIQTVNGPADFSGATVNYKWRDDKLFAIIAGVGGVTDFSLESGEVLTDSYAIGDPSRWVIDEIVSLENGEEVQHFIIRGFEEGASTTLIIPTNRRTYHILLVAKSGLGMTHVRFKYPSNIKRASSYSNENPSLQVDVSRLNLKYEILGKDTFGIERIFSDGKRTFIIFNKEFSFERSSPGVYLINRGQLEILNYVRAGRIYSISLVLGEGEALCVKEGEKEITIARRPE